MFSRTRSRSRTASGNLPRTRHLPLSRSLAVGLALATAALVAPVAPSAQAAPPASGAAGVHDRVRPLDQAHAHNDYEHERPLKDALSHGFTSVEADVYLVDGELLVAHDAEDVDPARTLQSLYLDPLAARVERRGGSVYRGWSGSLQLLVDVKSDASTTYTAITEALEPYRSMLTTWRDGRTHHKAVEVVISGNRDLPAMQAQDVRRAGYDGRLGDLGSGLSPQLMPLVSDNWTLQFTWTGEGPMPVEERQKLDDIVTRAHAAGYRIRFWATPDVAGEARDRLWKRLLKAGVDHLNTDDLAGLEKFLRAS